MSICTYTGVKVLFEEHSAYIYAADLHIIPGQDILIVRFNPHSGDFHKKETHIIRIGNEGFFRHDGICVVPLSHLIYGELHNQPRKEDAGKEESTTG